MFTLSFAVTLPLGSCVWSSWLSDNSAPTHFLISLWQTASLGSIFELLSSLSSEQGLSEGLQICSEVMVRARVKAMAMGGLEKQSSGAVGDFIGRI